MRWLATTSIIAAITAADPAVAAQAFRGGFGLLPGAPAPDGVVGMTGYKSLAAFTATLTIGTPWVMYDPECWPQTPAAEQQDPWTAMQHFGQLGHARHRSVMCTPARDLASADGTLQPRQSGEDVTAWYIRTAIAKYAAAHADAVVIQAQALQADVHAYASFVTAAASQVKAGNRWCQVWAGVSTASGTATEMAAAAGSVDVDGFWLNVPGPVPDVAEAVRFLRMVL